MATRVDSIKQFLNATDINAYIRSFGGQIHSIDDLVQGAKIITYNDTVYSQILDETQRSLRGLIFKVDPATDSSSLGEIQVLSLTYPVPYDTVVEVIDLNTVNLGEGMNMVITPLYDGILLRVTFINDKWRLSTNNKWNAYESRWNSGKSFGELFEEIIPFDKLTESLNKKYVYLFMLCHPETPVVIKCRFPIVYHVSTIDLATGTELSLGDFDLKDLKDSIVKPMQVLNEVTTFIGLNEILFTSVMEMYGYMVKIVSDNKVVSRYRCQSNMYTYIKQIIGKQPIRYEIMNLIRTDAIENWEERQQIFLRYYPHYIELYCDILNKMNTLGQSLYATYVSKYIKKQQTQLPHVVHDFLFNVLHKTHFKTNKTKITVQLVDEELHKMPLENYSNLFSFINKE